VSRVTTEKLHQELTITQNNLEHVHDCIHRLEKEVKDSRVFYTVRLDRLDNRIWMLMALTFTTFLTLFASLMFT